MIEVHRSLCASLAGAEALSLELRAALKEQLPPAEVFAVELMVRELLANAVEHGSGCDEGLRVGFDLILDGGVVTCRVADQGPGFDWRAVMDAHRMGGERGHGLFILETYADAFGWENGGSTGWFTRRAKGGPMGEATYVPGRDVVASAVDAVKAEIKQALEGSAGVFTIDLGGVEMVDSRGLGLLIATANSLNGSQRRLRIIHASADIAELMRMMRLDRHMEIV